MKAGITLDLRPDAPLRRKSWHPLINRVIFATWVCTLLLMVAVGAFGNKQLKKLEAEHLAEARSTLLNLTRVNEEHALRTFRAADQTLQFIIARYAAEGNQLDLADLVARGVIDAELFAQVGVMDADGIFRLSNGRVPKNLNLADREHFRVHLGEEKPFLHVSRPVLGRASGKWSIQLTRRVNHRDGSFGGVAVVSINIDYFTRFYDDLELPPNSMSALMSMNGVNLARKSDGVPTSGEDISRSPIFGMIAAGQFNGMFTSVSPVDNVERLVAYRKVPGFQLAVLNGISTQTLAWQNQISRDTLLWQTGAVCLLLLVIAAVLSRHLRQIQEKKEQLGVIFALSPDALVSFDRGFRVRYANPAFTSLTGLTLASITGMTEAAFSEAVNALCLTPGAPRGPSALRPSSVLYGKAEVELIKLARPSRRILHAQVRASESWSVSQILYLRDVTHETSVEEMKTQFVATAAHELRTPIACVLGFAEVLLAQQLDEPQRREFTGIILAQSKQMAVILDDLLDLARIESGQNKDFFLEPLDLQALVQNVVAGFGLPAGRLAPHVTLPVVFCSADRGKATQAILNVLTNAYKYGSQSGEVKITLAAPARGKNGELTGICIHDQGPGIRKEHLARIFERFYRVDTSGKMPGTGLGMSIVKEIMENHGGEARIDSILGQGTVVTLLFPVASDPGRVPGADNASGAPTVAA